MGFLRQKDKNKCCMGKTQWRLFHLCAREHNNCFLVKPLIYLSILNLENLMTQSAQAATPRKLSVIERTITVVLLTCHLECIHLMPQVLNGQVDINLPHLITFNQINIIRINIISTIAGWCFVLLPWLQLIFQMIHYISRMQYPGRGWV